MYLCSSHGVMCCVVSAVSSVVDVICERERERESGFA